MTIQWQALVGGTALDIGAELTLASRDVPLSVGDSFAIEFGDGARGGALVARVSADAIELRGRDGSIYGLTRALPNEAWRAPTQIGMDSTRWIVRSRSS